MTELILTFAIAFTLGWYCKPEPGKPASPIARIFAHTTPPPPPATPPPIVHHPFAGTALDLPAHK